MVKDVVAWALITWPLGILTAPDRGVRIDGALTAGLPTLDERPGGRRQIAVGVEREVAGTGVVLLPFLVGDQEAGALDRHIRGLVRLLDRALRLIVGHGSDPYAGPDRDGVDARALPGRRSRRAGDLFGQEVGEDGVLGLVARGVGVGDVVADDVEVRLVGLDTRYGGDE